MRNIPEWQTQNDKLLHDESIINEIKEWVGNKNSQVYYVCPDLLYRNKYSFDYNKFNTNPLTIKSTRLLTHKLKQENIIALCLNTSTYGYSYQLTQELILRLSELKNYQIYVPEINTWAGHKISLNIDKSKFPENVIVDSNPDFVESLKMVARSKVCICSDCGTSHLSFHLGQIRVLLDPWFGFSRSTLAHQVRWRENIEDSIPINTPPDKIFQLINVLLETPQTQLLPKNIVLNNIECDWARELLFKF